MDSRYSFLDQEPPPGYVAGIGRGATGFTTQADVGGAKISTMGLEEEDRDDEEKYVDAEEDGLLSSKNKDDEDDEADAIYEEIEARMKLRRKRKLEELEDESRETNLISEQFKDLKNALVTVSENEWLNLPEVGDLTRKNKRQRQVLQAQQRFYALPDSILNGMKNDNESKEEITDFKTISSAKDKLLELQLDNEVASTSVDSVEYLNSLDGLATENVANVKTARSVLSNLRKNEPKKASSWIASARLEERVKRFEAARSIIAQGCEINRLSDELWLENVRLNKKEGKVIIRQALSYIPGSIKLWMAAYQMENDLLHQKRLLRKALENIPTSIELWEVAISLETEEVDKKKLLSKAVELTNAIPFWLSLIDLENDNSAAKKLLNDARKQNPESIDIWIHAAKLEERTSENEVKISKLLSKGIKEINLSRDDYIKKAIEAELEGYPITCSVILQNVLDHDLDTVDDSTKISIWLNDAKMAIDKNFFETAKSIYQFILTKFPRNIQTWKAFLKFIKTHKPTEMFISFQEAIDANPSVELFWLWFAKEYMMEKNYLKSREVLNNAMKVLPDQEETLLALIKLGRIESNNPIETRNLYERGIKEIGTVRIFYKYVTFLRSIGDIETAMDIVDQALAKFPDCFKLYLQASQVYLSKGELTRAKNILSEGTICKPQSIPIWLSLSRLEESPLRKEAILDKAIATNPRSGLLWREKFLLEKKRDMKNARIILAKAMKLIPNSPELWCEYLLNLERKSQQKTSFRDAMANTNDNPLVLDTIGYILWKDGKVSRCKNFFDKSLELNNDIGDSWILLYLFLTRHGDPEEIDQFIKDMEAADPHHGEIWCEVTKDISMLNKSRKELLDEGVKRYLN